MQPQSGITPASAGLSWHLQQKEQTEAQSRQTQNVEWTIR